MLLDSGVEVLDMGHSTFTPPNKYLMFEIPLVGSHIWGGVPDESLSLLRVSMWLFHLLFVGVVYLVLRSFSQGNYSMQL